MLRERDWKSAGRLRRADNARTTLVALLLRGIMFYLRRSTREAYCACVTTGKTWRRERPPAPRCIPTRCQQRYTRAGADRRPMLLSASPLAPPRFSTQRNIDVFTCARDVRGNVLGKEKKNRSPTPDRFHRTRPK